MKIRLKGTVWVSDLDGTLLTVEHPLPEPAVRLVEYLSRQDATVIVATSRPVNSVARLFSSVATPVFAICHDGAVVARDVARSQQIVDEVNLTPFQAARAVDAIQGAGINWHNDILVFGAESGGAQVHIFACEKGHAHHLFDELRDTRRRTSVTSYDELTLAVRDRVRSVSILGLNRFSDAEESHLRAALGQLGLKLYMYPETRIPGYYWSDVLPVGLSKGSTLRRLLDVHDMSGQLTVLGNGVNDLELFKLANLALAPSDAHPEVQKFAHQVLPARGGGDFADAVMNIVSMGNQ